MQNESKTPVIDGHAHIGPREIGSEYSYMSDGYSAEKLIESMDRNGIDIATVWAMRQGDDYSKANEYIVRAYKNYPNRLVPFIRLNPWLENSVASLERAVDHHEAKGLKLHPADENFDPDESIVHPLLERAEKARLPVAFHTGSNARPTLVGDVADRFPRVKMILLHLGGQLYQDCMFVARKCDNIYLETAQCPYVNRIANLILEKVGPDRLIWGSDIPYSWHEIEKVKVD
ncbi:MAG: amidohydrolase family protein, partial [Thaumarchaeota archaeon]|nr:amidohydrolase family protein [Nitrososphaerota archaeon]